MTDESADTTQREESPNETRRAESDGEINRNSAIMEFGYWRDKAEENVNEWGLQDEETLLLAMQEELGEMTRAHLEAVHEDGDPARLAAELDDLGALCMQLRWRLENR